MNFALPRAPACWQKFQARVIALHNLLMGLATLSLLATNLVVGYLLVFHDVNPVKSDKTLSVTPENRYFDRATLREFRIIREVCSSRDQQVEVVRAWTEFMRDDISRPMVIFTSVYWSLKKGCNKTSVVSPIPETLPPGRYVYEVGVRACSVFGHCVLYRLEAVPVSVVGGELWPDIDVPQPPAWVPGSSSSFNVPVVGSRVIP